MLAASPTPSFPGAWPDWDSTDDVPPLPNKYIPPPDTALENDETTQDIDAPQDRDAPQQDASPSPLCLSPRPLPELPSLSSSLSTAESSMTNDSSTPPTSPDQPCSPIEVQPACTPPRAHSPILLDLREPRSPDSAHFSPAIDSFPSPSSSQLQLSLSNNCPGARSVESVATYHPSPSSPSILDDERDASQDVQRHPFPTEEVADDTDLRSQDDQQDQTFHVAKTSVGKRTFLSRVKRFGGRVRKLFKPRAVETRPRHNHSVSTRMPPPPVTLRLSESPKNRQGSEATYFIPRRFSLQSLLHSRLPPGSDGSNSRATAGDRLSTVVSAHEDRLSPQETPLIDAITVDVSGIVYHDVHPDRDHHEQKAEDQASANN